VIEDDLDLRQLLADELEDAGYGSIAKISVAL